jgi:hypothetical protein
MVDYGRYNLNINVLINHDSNVFLPRSLTLYGDV